MTSPCRGGFERVLYGWGKNAPAMALPKGVGYSVGPGSAIQSLVLQVSSMPSLVPSSKNLCTIMNISSNTVHVPMGQMD